MCSYLYSFNKKSITNIEDKEYERTEIYLKNMKLISDNKEKRDYDIGQTYILKLEKYSYLSSLLNRYDIHKKRQLYEWYHKYCEDYFNYRRLKGSKLAKILYFKEYDGKIDFKDLKNRLVNVDENNPYNLEE